MNILVDGIFHEKRLTQNCGLASLAAYGKSRGHDLVLFAPNNRRLDEERAAAWILERLLRLGPRVTWQPSQARKFWPGTRLGTRDLLTPLSSVRGRRPFSIWPARFSPIATGNRRRASPTVRPPEGRATRSPVRSSAVARGSSWPISIPCPGPTATTPRTLSAAASPSSLSPVEGATGAARSAASRPSTAFRRGPGGGPGGTS